jgi:hypothetical protein
VRILPCFCFAIATSVAQAAVSGEIDLSTQTSWILQDGKRVYETPISSGRSGSETPTGDFAVLEKDRKHYSTLHGRLVAADGSILKADATPVPERARFERVPRKWLARFSEPVGMHAGRLPGYAASHGYVRLPADKAHLSYDIVVLGTPVRVSGSTPDRNSKSAPPATSSALVSVPPKPAGTKGWLPWFRRSSSENPETRPRPAMNIGTR